MKNKTQPRNGNGSPAASEASQGDGSCVTVVECSVGEFHNPRYIFNQWEKFLKQQNNGLQKKKKKT